MGTACSDSSVLSRMNFTFEEGSRELQCILWDLLEQQETLVVQ